MYRKIGFVFLVTCLIGALGFDAEGVTAKWKYHKYKTIMYKVDLGGSSPTQTQCTDNFVVAGDLILDTSNGTLYRVLNPTGPVLETITAAGAQTLPSLTVTGVTTTSADVNNDATGGTTSDPDFDVDGYAKFNGVVELDSALSAQYANKTANYTNTSTDLVLSYDTSAITTNTLPEASTVLGRIFIVCLQDDDGDLVVMTDGTDKFDGSNDILTFADAGDSCAVMATATNVYTILWNVGGTLSN